MTYRGNFSKHSFVPETGSPGYARTRLAQSSQNKSQHAGCSASLSFLGCPMRPTSSWVNERSSQYLIYLVIISNSQPRNEFLHIDKNNKNVLKYQNKTKI